MQPWIRHDTDERKYEETHSRTRAVKSRMKTHVHLTVSRKWIETGSRDDELTRGSTVLVFWFFKPLSFVPLLVFGHPKLWAKGGGEYMQLHIVDQDHSFRYGSSAFFVRSSTFRYFSRLWYPFRQVPLCCSTEFSVSLAFSYGFPALLHSCINLHLPGKTGRNFQTFSGCVFTEWKDALISIKWKAKKKQKHKLPLTISISNEHASTGPHQRQGEKIINN